MTGNTDLIWMIYMEYNSYFYYVFHNYVPCDLVWIIDLIYKVLAQNYT